MALPHILRLARFSAAACCVLLACACTTFNSHWNEPLPSPPAAGASAPPAPAPTLATFQIDGHRGNPRVLMFLTISGGGSRAAHLAAAAMLKLQTVYPEVDLLQEVDVMSSVSGGSVTAALYAATRDTALVSPQLATALPYQIVGTPLAARISLDPTTGALTCHAPLLPGDLQQLQSKLPALRRELQRLDNLCRQAPLKHLRDWEHDSVLELTRRNYLGRWIGNWFWPHNIARYWLTAYDRGDIMAATLGDNLYGTRLLGGDLRFHELNPTRPYLLINATTAADQDAPGINAGDEYAFGSVFAFTEQDFRERLNSDLGGYSVARAVMASSAFPLVFPNQTLQDYRPAALQPVCGVNREGERKCTDRQFLHVFDGGNSDNLGLKSVKRALFQLEAKGQLHYDRIIVMQIDAFTRPHGASRLDPDPRGTLGLLLDANLSDAVDSLLQNNRVKLLGEFDSGRLRWTDGSCSPETRELPSELCRALDARGQPDLDLQQRMVFYHFGFDDVLRAGHQHDELKRQLDTIPTSFKLSERDARLLTEAVDVVLTPANPCLREIRDLVLAEGRVSPQVVERARRTCKDVDPRPVTPGR